MKKLSRSWQNRWKNCFSLFVFFSSTTLVKRLFENNIYATETVRSSKKQMPTTTDDKKMKRGDSQFLFSNKVTDCKWMDNWSVLLLLTALEGLNNLSTFQWKEKCSKSDITCPKDVKLCNDGMGGFDFIDQTAASYRLDCKSSVRFYHRIFFHLIDIACANSNIVYNMRNPEKLTPLDFKIVVAKNLIQ